MTQTMRFPAPWSDKAEGPSGTYHNIPWTPEVRAEYIAAGGFFKVNGFGQLDQRYRLAPTRAAAAKRPGHETCHCELSK